MSASPKKPNLSSIFKQYKNKSSPAGSLDLPADLPNIQEITADKIPAPSSPKKGEDIKAIIQSKYNKPGEDFEKIIADKGFTLDNKYLTSNKGGSLIAYYTKVHDKYGTPLYVNLGNYNEPLNLDPNSFNGNMILVEKTEVSNALLNYIVTTNNTNDKLLECKDGAFCVIKQNNDGTATVDKFMIPSAAEIEANKRETASYQTPRAASEAANIDFENPVVYSIVSFEAIKNDMITSLQYEDWFKTYQKNILDLQNTSTKNIEYLNTKVNDIKIVIGHTLSNRALAFDKTNKYKKDQKFTFDKPTTQNITTNIKACNEALEKYINLSNNISKLTYETKIVYDTLVKNGNEFYNTYEKLTNIISNNININNK